MRRISAFAALVLLLSFWTLPADAGTEPAGSSPERLRLDATVKVDVVQRSSEPGACDDSIRNYCGYNGYIGVTMTFSGFEGRHRMSEVTPYGFYAGGTARVTRTYGCQTPAGQRLRAFDRRVHESVDFYEQPYGQPFGFPSEGSDEKKIYTAGHLRDRQPGNCPDGTEARLYRIVAQRVQAYLHSQIASVPNATYRLRGATWNGSMPTPELARPVIVGVE